MNYRTWDTDPLVVYREGRWLLTWDKPWDGETGVGVRPMRWWEVWLWRIFNRVPKP